MKVRGSSFPVAASIKRRISARARCPGQLPYVGGHAFTLTDLLIVLAVLSILAMVVVAGQAAAKAKSRLALCSANLGTIDRSVHEYAADHGQKLPGAAVADDNRAPWWWYKEDVKRYAGLAGESSPKDAVFACPEDRGYSDPIPFHASARFDFSSYVFNGVTFSGLPNVAGLALAAIHQPKRTLLVMEWTAHAPLSWHRSKTGRANSPFYCDAQSVVGFVDGHVSLIPIYYDGYNAAYTQDPISGYDYQFSPN